MKRILITLLCITFGLLQLNAQSHRIVSSTDNQITFTVTTGGLSVSDITTEQGVFSRLMLDGCAASVDNVGKPELPIIIKTIEIPVCGDVHVTATAGRVRTLTAAEAGIRHTVYPTQPLYHKSYMGDRTFAKDEATYRTSENYGMPLATVAKAGIARDVCMADVRICPVQVNPVTNTVTIYDDINITVTYDNVDMAATRELKLKYGSAEFGRPVQLINGIESAQIRDAISTRPVKMLIIANSLFEGQLESFANWKRRKGFIVEIAYTGTIGTTTTAITNYIGTQFTNATADNPAPTYVLLVGDQAQIPTYSGQSINSHVSDLYYFTQVGSDNVPDCYWGRFSAQTVAQLTPQIDKTMKYEQLSMGNDLTYLDRCVLVAGNDGGSSGDYGYSHANPAMHYFEDNYSSTFFTTTDSYYNPHASSDASTIRTKLSNGTAYANYSAHCSSSGWADPAFTTSNISSLSNTGKYGFMVGNCCQSNKFEESECFGEAIMRATNKGAVGYIGGTDYTYWDHDYYWAVGVRSGNLSTNCTNCNLTTYDANNLGAYDKMCHTHGESFSNWNVTQGSINYAGNMAVQSKYGASDNYVKYYWEIYELMGDPSVMPWLGQPADMTIRVDNVAPISNTIELIDGTTTIAVSTGAPYSYVALTQDLNLITATLTDANGNCTLTFPALTSGMTYELAASAQNYKTTFTTINCMAGEGARVIITNVNITNDEQAVDNASLTLDVTIENRFPDAATNTVINAATSSSQITLTDATETVGTVNSGATTTLSASFALNVGNAISDGDIATIEFTVSYLSQGNAETTTYTYDLVLVDALLAYVSDSYTIMGGNNDDIINPGETVSISIVDENAGHATAQNIVSELATYYNLTPIANNVINIGAVNAQAQCTSTFTVSIDANVPNGTMVPFFHHIYSTTNAALSRVDTVWIMVGESTATETWESGDMSQFAWTTSSDYPWTIENSGAYAGTYCARAGNHNVNSSNSELELTINAPVAGEVSYYSKVSSESNYDFFRFYLDGVQMEQRSGNGSWVLSTWPIEAGTHTLKFAYEKDYSQHGNSDYAWVDNITFPGGGEIAPEPEALNDISHSVIITTGNGDADINPGETIDLTITTENLSAEPLANVSSVLTTTSPYVTIGNANETIAVIPANGTATTAFHITIDPATPDSTLIVFNHVASTLEHTSPTYTATINVFEVASPRLVKTGDSYVISGGNNDNTIDAGETVTLTILDENTGRADAPDVVSHLSTYYTPAAVVNGTITVGTIEANSEYASVFTINVGADVPVGTVIPYIHHIFSTTDARADRTDTIYLTVGSTAATEDWETGDFTQYEWTNNSTYPWVIVNDATGAVGGSFYAKSGNASQRNSQSDLSLNITTTDGEISFYAKVASEPNADFFKFYIDETETYSYSGGVMQNGSGWNVTYTDTCTWQRLSFPISAGDHTIRFSFTKNNRTNAGSDCAKVDNITWPTAGGGIAPMPEGIVITSAGLNASSNGYELETAAFDVSIENNSTETIENVTLTMTTTSANLTLTDATETVASIGGGQTLDLASIFAGNIAAVADGHVVNCTVTADYLLENVPTQQTYSFSFTVHSAILQDMTHSETITVGNGDADINPGETIEITVTTGNIGVAGITGVSSELTTVSPYATIVNATETIASIAANGTASATYTVSIAPATPDNTDIVFTHTASEAIHGSSTISFTINVVEVAVAHLVDVNHNETILSGNNDNVIDAGEIVRVNINTRNDGRAAASNAVSELVTDSEYATINNGTQQIGMIAPNASVNSQFDIVFAEDVPDQTVITFTHTMYSDEDTCTMTFNITVTAYIGTSDLKDANYTISVVSGNDDDDINPAETIKVTVYSRNDGDGIAENVTSTLMTTSAYASISEPVVSFSMVAPNASLTSQYTVDIDENTANNTTIAFNHMITDGTSSDNLSFNIIVVRPAVGEGVSENGTAVITLYPNPTTSSVNVDLGESVRATDIRLFNAFGQLISTVSVHSSVTAIDLSQMPAGIYFVQIFNNDELITTGKVVRK